MKKRRKKTLCRSPPNHTPLTSAMLPPPKKNDFKCRPEDRIKTLKMFGPKKTPLPATNRQTHLKAQNSQGT